MTSVNSGAILIADDSDDDAKLLRRQLLRLGYHYTAPLVHDGTETIAYLKGEGKYSDRANFPYPILLALDLEMRPMTGFDVLRWLQANPTYKTFPVFVLTVLEGRHEVHEAYKLGAATFVTKPITEPTLKEALDAMKIKPPGRLFYQAKADDQPEAPALPENKAS